MCEREREIEREREREEGKNEAQGQRTEPVSMKTSNDRGHQLPQSASPRLGSVNPLARRSDLTMSGGLFFFLPRTAPDFYLVAQRTLFAVDFSVYCVTQVQSFRFHFQLIWGTTTANYGCPKFEQCPLQPERTQFAVNATLGRPRKCQCQSTR